MDYVRLRPWIGTAVRLLLGVVWIWSSWSKLSDPLHFVQAVRAYDATPEWLAKGIGYGLPVLELGLGVVLILGVAVRIAAAVSAVLFFLFLIALIQAAARGLSLSCGCFGGGGPTDGPTNYLLDIVRDVALLIAAGYLVLWSHTRLSIEEYLARNDHVLQPSAKRMRTPEARKRYEAQVAASRAKARSRARYVDGSVLMVIVLVSIIGIGVQSGRAKIDNVIPGQNATAANGVVFGKKAAATVDIYEDFGCPNCFDFEQATRTVLEADVRANLAQVRYHPISFLDGSSLNEYSTRAANAALCVSDVSVEAFVRYHGILFGKDSAGAQVQPKEGTAGPGNAKLTALAKQAKLAPTQVTSVSDCVLSGQFKPLVAQLTDKASERGVHGTPTILVNGKELADHSSATLFAAIAAANKGHTPVPSKTPSPSASASVSGTGSGSTSTSPSTSPSRSSSPSKSASRSASTSPSK